MKKETTWNAVAWVAAAGAAWAAREAATAVWRRLSDSDPPAEVGRDDTPWTQAVAWVVLAGLLAASARVVARKGAATAWEAVTGESPPGV